jgi:NAD(P)-dependent dehydrogenase (short-subunit alcohol dehydrogenase family)
MICFTRFQHKAMHLANMFNLKGKTILVTGASSGLGRAAAVLMSRLGASVVISGRNKNELDVSLSQMAENESKHYVVPCDLSAPEAIKKLVDEISQITNKIDGIVHCAGISITEPLRFINAESVDAIMDLNVKSAIYLISEARKRRLFNKGASVVLLSSTAALIGEVGISAYAASKGAIIALTKSLAAELVNPGRIRVNCLVPATVKTALIEKKFEQFSNEVVEAHEKRHPLGFGQPEDVAKAIAFFISDASSWITGTCLVIDGGYSLAVGYQQ